MDIDGYKYLENATIVKELVDIFENPTLDLLKEEDRQAKREYGLTLLLEVGYITKEERGKYAKELQELPTGRKDLVVAYFLENYRKDISGKSNLMQKAHNLNKEYGLETKYKAALSRGKDETELTLADIMGDEASQEYKAKYKQLIIADKIGTAELYVDSKRKRIRKRLEEVALLLLIQELQEEPGEELDSIAYFRSLLESNGYSDKRKSLNDKDKNALREAAAYANDLLELTYLNGAILPRLADYAKVRDEEGTFTETFIYRDVYDEALLLLEPLPLLLHQALNKHYADETAKELLGTLDVMQSKCQEIINEDIKGTKFETLIK